MIEREPAALPPTAKKAFEFAANAVAAGIGLCLGLATSITFSGCGPRSSDEWRLRLLLLDGAAIACWIVFRARQKRGQPERLNLRPAMFAFVGGLVAGSLLP